MSHIKHSGINLQSFHLLLATLAPFHSWVSSWPKNSPPNKLHHCGRKPKTSPTKQGPQPKEPWRQVTTKSISKRLSTWALLAIIASQNQVFVFQQPLYYASQFTFPPFPSLPVAMHQDTLLSSTSAFAPKTPSLLSFLLSFPPDFFFSFPFPSILS